jgi:hypothetical protein
MNTQLVESCVAFVGIGIGLILMLVGRKRNSPIELRYVGGFLLLASFCYLLRIQMPSW